MVRTFSASRPIRFLAREHELERIRARLEAVESGAGGIIAVSGPPGIGVSSLALEIADRASTAGFAVASGSCVVDPLGRPFSGLADALEQLARGHSAEALQDDLGADAGPISRICPVISTLLPTIAPAVPLDPADERLRLYESVVGWLRRVSTRQPLLIVLDDTEEAGPDLVDLLKHFALRLRDSPVLFLVSLGQMDGLDAVALENVDVGPLDEGAVGALLGQIANVPLNRDLISLVHERSIGNPLFAIELYRHLVDEGFVGEVELPNRDSLPGSLGELVAWRLSRLSGDARTALETVACFPDGAPTQLVATVLAASRSRAVTLLESGVDAGLVAADNERGVYAMGQRALRTAVLLPVDGGTLARLHRRIATAIEDEGRERLRERAAELTHHYAESSSLDGRERGLNFALLTAEQARAAYAYRRAVQCLVTAFALAPERDRALRTDLLGRLAFAKAAAGMRAEAMATTRQLIESMPSGAVIPDDMHAAVVDALRALRRTGLPEKDATAIERLRQMMLAHAALAAPLVRARLDLLGEHWATLKTAGIPTLTWSGIQTDAARLLAASASEGDGAEVMLAQRARTQSETAQAHEFARAWRRPQAVLRAQRALVTDLVWRQGLFREATGRAEEYDATARRFGAHRDHACALLFLARANVALGNFAASDEAIADAEQAMAPLDGAAELSDELLLSRLALMHFRDGGWADYVISFDPGNPGSAGRHTPSAAGLLFAAQRAVGESRIRREAEARSMLPALLEAAAHQPPLTLYRDPALVATLAAAWELGAAEHAATGRSLVNLAAEAGVGGQLEGSLAHTRARMLALAGDVPAARDVFADERPALDRAGQRPLRAILDHDEAIAIAAAGRQGYAEATRLLETAATQFETLGMAGWLKRTRDLLATGLEAAAAPGGRLAFTYPQGLSRREADVVRLVAAGAATQDVAATLVLDHAVVERLVSSALEKLGSDQIDELPRLARRYGLGGS